MIGNGAMEPEGALCCSIRQGEKEPALNFERQVCEQIPHLRRYARALCGDSAAADDLVQDCLERALHRRHLWRPKGRLRSWLFRILYRIYLNDRASARSRREVVTPDAGDSLTAVATQETHVHCRDVMNVVDELPSDQRAALLLITLEGPDYREAARILDINIGTLRSRLARARETVRRRCDRDRSEAERLRLRRVK